VEAKALDLVHGVFNSKALRRGLLALRVPLTLGVAAALCYFARREWFLPGLVVSAVGGLLQLWCFSAIDKQKELAVNGPYKVVRNPMYLARFLLILGFVLLTGNPWVVGLYVIVYYFYMVNRVKREERKLHKVFGEPYAEYMRQVHRFLPASAYARGRLLYGRLDLLVRNNGHWNILAVAAFYAVCYLVVFRWRT
jgi:protein-S-isoprenylcysteine O-methyltransferase Ste14